jgi:PAS domain S-box-containing protein
MNAQRPWPPGIGNAVLHWLDSNSTQGILITDAALIIRGWNHWLATVTGLPEDSVVGRPLIEVVPSLRARGFEQYYTEALQGEAKILSHAFHRYLIPTAETVVRTSQMSQTARIVPLSDNDVIIGTLTVIEDVSDRVANEQELRGRIAAAEAASRVKDEFLATLSHEIRTPLNAVLGWTRILKGRANLDAETVKRAIEVIDRNASAQLTLVSDMLDMARISSGKVRLEMSDVDLAAVAIGAVDAVRPAADAKGVRLLTDLAPQLPAVAGDADRLLQVVWNLLSNAVKFTDHGGQVTLTLAADARNVTLAVTDTGHGIAPSFLPHVFERFKQADPSSSRRYGGLGLGLALVKELVELHGGAVSAESGGAGKGATFRVRLPARNTVARVTVHIPTRPAFQGALSGVRILVIEDDADATEIILQTVSAAGALVTCATSVAEALALMRDPLEHPGVIVTDIGMPDDDGFALLEQVRKLPVPWSAEVPVIALTAYATPEDRARALAAGFQAHLGKPFAPDELIAAIARAAEV